ncbi:hypothetical protein [Herbaspirillum seropedicae]|uniref:hypothetical protein n=1 Tax=Herbaspirillum seropedicae TaxID=964 RepID=UPI003D9756B5
MISRKRLRLIADYFAAIRNEVAVDEMFLALSKKNAAEVGYFPRVPRWIGLARRKPYLTRIGSRVARVLWLYGGAALFFIAEYLKIGRLHRLSDVDNSAESEGTILGFSSRVADIITPLQFPAFPRTWLTFPWVSIHRLPEGAKELPLLSLLDKRDLLRALGDAMIATQRFKRDEHLSFWVLQTYTAFRWFLARRAVDKLNGSLVTAEHYDRWAVLADRATRESRRSRNNREHLIIVQHGAMGTLNQDRHPSNLLLNLPTRLHQVDELHVYNSDEATVFRTSVLAPGAASRKPTVHFFRPGIRLQDAGNSDKPRLLFVGHPLCEVFQAEVFRKLKAWKQLDIYYKPHPKAPMSASMAAFEWQIIKEADIFPSVDLLVSYPSTLVMEYEGLGIAASVHSLDASMEALCPFVEEIQRTIEYQLLERRRAQEAGTSAIH